MVLGHRLAAVQVALAAEAPFPGFEAAVAAAAEHSWWERKSAGTGPEASVAYHRQALLERHRAEGDLGWDLVHHSFPGRPVAEDTAAQVAELDSPDLAEDSLYSLVSVYFSGNGSKELGTWFSGGGELEETSDHLEPVAFAASSQENVQRLPTELDSSRVDKLSGAKQKCASLLRCEKEELRV